jgi:hypothetical protein
MKRKQTSELRTNPVGLSVARTPPKGDLFQLTKMQPFFPPIECLFKTNSLERVHEFGIKLRDPISTIKHGDIGTLASGRFVTVHPKITMLLSPFKCMKGEFGTFGLPMLSEHARETQSKLQSHNTAGYVGSILSVALSESGCEHFPEVVGVFNSSFSAPTLSVKSLKC